MNAFKHKENYKEENWKRKDKDNKKTKNYTENKKK